MNPKQLTAFQMVMRHGSITAAAHALSVSQPAVSRLIADLEADIGFPLLHRFGGGSQPTLEAYEFFQEVERLYYGLDRLSQVASEIKTLERAALRIASMPMVSFEILPEALRCMIDNHKGITVSHDVHTSSRILDLLASRQIDLGIAQTDPARKDVEVLAAFRTQCVCVMDPDHELAKSELLTPLDLKDQPLIMLNFRTLTYSYLMQCFAEAGLSPNVVAETQPSYSACSLAALKVGIAIVDPITPEIFGDRVVSVPFEPDIPFDYQILKPSELPLPRVAAQFFDTFLDVVAKKPQYGKRVHNISA